MPRRGPRKAFVGVEKPWERIRAAIGLEDVRIHDFRHCFASTAVTDGHSLWMVGKLLGHKQTATTERYSHLADHPARAVADANGAKLMALLEQTAAPKA
jgi:site-specific recombinase XerD